MSNPPKEFERVIRGIAVNSSGNLRSTKRLSKKWRVMVALVILGVSGTLLAAYIRSGGVRDVDTQTLQLASLNSAHTPAVTRVTPAPALLSFSGTALDRLDSKKFDLLRDVFVGVSSDTDAIDALLKEFQRTRAPPEARKAVAQDMISQLVRARGETRRLVSWARNRDSRRYYSKFGVIPRR